MRIVIVGASGNLGTALLRRALREPEVQLVGVSRRRPADEAPYSAAEWHPLDIAGAGAPSRLRAVFDGADAVVHLGWKLQPNHDEAELARTNVHGTRVVLETAAAVGVPHVLVASSVGAYSFGPKHSRVSESWPTGGIQTSHYARHPAGTRAPAACA